MWAIEDAINNFFKDVELISAIVIAITESSEMPVTTFENETFMITTKGMIFCHVIKIRLLRHEILFLIFSSHLCIGNIPILETIPTIMIAIRLGLFIS